MKTSRFVKSFEGEVDKWEQALSRITETVEMLLTVQRHWLYMETIFMGDDIRQQLPRESKMFDDLDVMWKRITIKMNEVRNAQKCSMIEGKFRRNIITRSSGNYFENVIFNSRNL